MGRIDKAIRHRRSANLQPTPNESKAPFVACEGERARMVQLRRASAVRKFHHSPIALGIAFWRLLKLQEPAARASLLPVDAVRRPPGGNLRSGPDALRPC